jgi:DNA invertase Pin-like site-specific DNA recombinase
MARIGYRRVSSEEQDFHRQELSEVDELFEEKESGAKRDRPALKELLRFARKGDEVVVWSLDRLGRDLRDLQGIVEELTSKGATVRFLKEQLTFAPDESNPYSRLQLQMMGAFAEFERAIIRERQREGIARAKERGVYRGRRPSIDKEAVLELKAQGVGASEIARRLKIGRASVYRLLEASTVQNS